MWYVSWRNSLKRFQRRAYVPKPNENSAGINHARFAEVVGCDGIYKAVSINKHVVKVVFDTVQGKVLEGIYYPWNEQKKLKLPPNCEIGIECKHAYRGERCCDLMHCKHKCGEEFCMWRGGTWMNPRKEDISKMRDSHIFEPKFSPGKTIVTHGYKKYMTLYGDKIDEEAAAPSTGQTWEINVTTIVVSYNSYYRFQGEDRSKDHDFLDNTQRPEINLNLGDTIKFIWANWNGNHPLYIKHTKSTNANDNHQVTLANIITLTNIKPE